MADPDDPFLTRWSRRKRTASDDANTPDEPASKDPPPAGGSRPGEDTTPETAMSPEQAEIVAQLPDIDSLEDGSDFTVFLQDGVPEALRRRALRKLWRLNPVYANLDGLNDYDEDFTLATSALTAVKTIYKVGKGMISEEDEEPKPSAPETPVEPIPVADSEEPPVDEESEEEESADKESADAESADEPLIVSKADQDALESPAEAELTVGPKPPSAPSGRSASERRWGAFRRG
jgi:hypothetical protein